jgi:hypothetical protein
MNPTNIEPVDTMEPIRPDGWSRIFPHASVTVISIDRK